MRSVLVIGPESSGTKLVTQILVANGCAGTFTDSQPWFPKGNLPVRGRWECFVTRCSLPHGDVWYEPRVLIRRFEANAVVLTVREKTAMVRSQVNRGHVRSEAKALERIAKAFRVMAQVPAYCEDVYVMPYEALVLSPEVVQKGLLAWLGLPQRHVIDVYDGDSKHYKEVGSG